MGGAFLVFTGVSAILHGEDERLLEMFGESACLLTFGGFIVCRRWGIGDQFRQKALAHEQAAAYADLERRGYGLHHESSGQSRLCRLRPRQSEMAKQLK